MIGSAARTGLPDGLARVKEVVYERTPESLKAIAEVNVPLVLKGFVRDWPVVRAAASLCELKDYLNRFDRGAVIPISAGPAELNGRLYYNADMSGMNVDRGNASMTMFLDRVFRYGPETPPPLIYLASTDVEECLPGFRAENDVDFGDLAPLRSVWIGTRTRVAAHNDLPLNIACVAAGKRRFTLFPPDQTPNLYVGPFELTPAGRPISLVDFEAPDLGRFPRFSDALAAAQVAELEAGDAIFIPSMWWHHVEALDAVNILVNYWWRSAPAHLGAPQDALNHAMMTLRDLPPEEKRIWQHMFNHYVFDNDENTAAHIPEHARGILGPVTEDMAQRVRAFLVGRLNR